MIENNANLELRKSARRMEVADDEAVVKEQEFKAEQNKWWRQILKKIRPSREETTTRQDVLDDLENIPDLAMPLRLVDVIEDKDGTAKVLADEELKAFNLSDDKEAEARKILEKIAQESFDQYHSADSDEGRKEAVKDASEPGKEHATELIKAVLDEDYDAQYLVGKLTLDNLIDQILPNLQEVSQIAKKNLDMGKIKDAIQEFANDDKYFSGRDVLKVILDHQGDGLNKDQSQALVVAATGVHVSWAAIQGPRTTTEQADRYVEMVSDRESTLGEDLAEKYSDLRIFRSVNRTFPVMQRNKYQEGLETDNDQDRAVALAVFEVLKDLVKIGLPKTEETT